MKASVGFRENGLGGVGDGVFNDNLNLIPLKGNQCV